MIKKAIFCGSYTDLRKLPKDSLPQIAFAGRSNVGKSSLLNVLTGQRGLARVSRTPGRTQMINFFLIDERCYFVDLPGYGYADAPQKTRDNWGKAVDIYVNNVENLCGMIFLIDCRREPNEHDLMLLDWIESRKIPFLPVLTKTDKLGRGALIKTEREMQNLFKVPPVSFSIMTGAGKKEVLQWIETQVAKFTKRK